MSGHKRLFVSLGIPDSRRMQELNSRLQSVERDSERIQSKIKEIRTEQSIEALDRLHSRQDNFTHSLERLDNGLHAVEQRTAEHIQEQTALMYIQLNEIEDEIWNDTSSLLQKQALIVQNVLDDSMTAQQQELITLKDSLCQLQRSYDQKEVFASAVLQNTFALIETLSQTYDHERYLPGVLAEEEKSLDIAQHNIWEGFFEAGLAIAQQSYLRISAARLEIENIILQNELVISETITKACSLLTQLDEIRSVQAIDLGGNDLDIPVDVDHWTWGSWHETRRDCIRLLNRLQRDRDVLTLEELTQISDRFDELVKRMPDILSEARQNILSSQIRYNIAGCVVDALHEQGFNLFESFYEREDSRLPYHTTLKNYDGSEVLVIVTPNPQYPLSHTIDVISKDDDIRTEHELRNRANELKESLQVYGLNVNLESIVNEGTRLPQELFSTRKLGSNTHREVKKTKF